MTKTTKTQNNKEATKKTVTTNKKNEKLTQQHKNKQT